MYTIFNSEIIKKINPFSLCFAETNTDSWREKVPSVPERPMPRGLGDVLPHVLVLGESSSNAAQTLRDGEALGQLQKVSTFPSQSHVFHAVNVAGGLFNSTKPIDVF